MNKKDQKYIFLHIPKNGGTTLQYIIDSQYRSYNVFHIGEEKREERIKIFKSRSDFLKRFIKVVKGGHFSFGLHEYFKNSMNVKYFAFLRNPVDRTLSYYHYAKRNPNHYLHKTLNDEKVSLKEFLNRPDLNAEINNGQTKLLCGIDQLQKCTNQDFEKAKYNLSNHFFLLGIIEYYLETLFFLKQDLNWSKPIYYNILNINKAKNYEVENYLNEKIIGLNQYDLEIYKTYYNIFQERMSNMNLDEFKKFKRSLIKN